MKTDPLARRRDELTARAEMRNIDWRAQLEGLPRDDDGLMVAALASLLGVNIRRAFDVETRLEDLERLSLRSEVEKEVRDGLLYRHFARFGESAENRRG